MARIRTVKPDIWLSPQVMNLEVGARLLFIGLITQADDQGRGVADARRLKAAIFPGDDVTAAQVDGWLSAIEAEGIANLYQAEGHGRLFQLLSWHIHQSINKPKPSNYPPPTGYTEDKDGIAPVLVQAESRGIGREGNGKEGKGHALPRAPGLNADAWEAWIDYRRSIGKPLKPASHEEAAKKLAAFGADQGAVVSQSIAQGWQGLFALKVEAKCSGSEPSGELSGLKARARVVGFRDIHAGESVSVYRERVIEAESKSRRNGGPQRFGAVQ
jgi:hypothetical protein